MIYTYWNPSTVSFGKALSQAGVPAGAQIVSVLRADR